MDVPWEDVKGCVGNILRNLTWGITLFNKDYLLSYIYNVEKILRIMCIVLFVLAYSSKDIFVLAFEAFVVYWHIGKGFGMIIVLVDGVRLTVIILEIQNWSKQKGEEVNNYFCTIESDWVFSSLKKELKSP